jgi:lysyl-tRNA synthetase, class II
MSLEENVLIATRRGKLDNLRESGYDFPNDFKPTHYSDKLILTYSQFSKAELEEQSKEVKIAGRIVLHRDMGKLCFIHIEDNTGRIQILVSKDSVGEDNYVAVKKLDIGDIIGVVGVMFKTNKGELSVKVSSFMLLTKALRQPPEKHSGLTDQEQKYRYRYLDLMSNKGSKDKFVLRSKAITAIRNVMVENDFLEVETPMLHPIPGGANAKPFVTHHNALDQSMYLRIAPELYLKKLVIGGYDKVFEINRNFRNEGLSVRHNPEFTMLEFYSAYWNHIDVMDYVESLLRTVAIVTTGSDSLTYSDKLVDLSIPFKRISVENSLVEYAGLTKEQAIDFDYISNRLSEIGGNINNRSLRMAQFSLFEADVETKLWNPTFITDYPVEVSPLARQSSIDPSITERFELFITGREFGNGFSELNDPELQAKRFSEQAENKNAGDDEAMFYDSDYIQALEHGLPPTGGCGIGIDRLIMLLTNSANIKDVILFPALRTQ